MRKNNRNYHETRVLQFESNCNNYADGSCLVSTGNTKVICTASIDNHIPHFLRNKKQGWITAEYNMLPMATHTRNTREKVINSGRTKEIQRLIGRSLRSCIDLSLIPNIQIRIDCDVIQADGSTRAASINGAYVALALALKKLNTNNIINNPITTKAISAISCGIVNNHIMIDLDYEEDLSADADASFVIDENGLLSEVQVTAEHKRFNAQQLSDMLAISIKVSKEINILQKKAIET